MTAALLAAAGSAWKATWSPWVLQGHQGINALLVQGVPPSKLADLAGHSLAIQQRIYKKYSLEEDHTVLRDDSTKPTTRKVTLNTDQDLPQPWEIDPESGEWFPDRE